MLKRFPNKIAVKLKTIVIMLLMRYTLSGGPKKGEAHDTDRDMAFCVDLLILLQYNDELTISRLTKNTNEPTHNIPGTNR